MAYIGKIPTVGNFQKCDAITTSAATTFNLLVGSVAVFPETANNCIVSLNGVIQAPTSAYTIVGSTIVFNSALTSADVIDFILILGNVLDIGTPSDGTVSTAKVADDAITTAKIPNDAITLAKMASGTDGNVISYDASGNPVAIATGSDGQVLTSTGAGSPPAFEALPASGGLTYLNSVTASNDASIAITSGIDSTYDAYLFTFNDIVPATNNTGLYINFQIGGAYINSGGVYEWLHQAGKTDGSTQFMRWRNDSEDDYLELTYEVSNVTANGGLSGHMYMYTPASTTHYTKVEFNFAAYSDGYFRPANGAGSIKNAAAVTGVKWYMSSGNITSGTVRMYGITNS